MSEGAIILCKLCKKEDRTNYSESINAMMIFRGMCFNCSFWTDMTILKDDPNSIRIKGEQFMICAETNAPDWEKGFGGRGYKIKLQNGTIVKTNNLWSQGTIPERFRDRLPDNAEFIFE